MPKTTYSVLLVDDSRDYRNLLSLYLSELPCEMTIAVDGEDAVEAYAAREFDLVIMDIIMPLMDGVDAIEAIRRMEQESARNPIPILAMSMEDAMDTSADCIRVGATRMLLKSSSRQDLLNTVSELLDVPRPAA